MERIERILQRINFKSDGLVPVATQDEKTGQVLMLAYMNREALERTLSTGKMHYFRRAVGRLWCKGEESGKFQYVKAVRVNCYADSLLFLVDQVDAACHEGYFSCYFREFDEEGNLHVIAERIFDPDEVYKKK
ncbi:MAG TPA: phosphoribosyl-AMP cyclohydrolase [bacterium]|nr:phosphoribosyl-AMP cyclohydrolase [bacterium]HPO09518.1 phosphoribosyl-AMP cyclohydrolase [bacterium]HQQ01292.1 phosphoribosyl-AMP cyclohydrolase [bacterium]